MTPEDEELATQARIKTHLEQLQALRQSDFIPKTFERVSYERAQAWISAGRNFNKLMMDWEMITDSDFVEAEVALIPTEIINHDFSVYPIYLGSARKLARHNIKRFGR